MEQKLSYPVQRGSPKMKDDVYNLPLTGQGKTLGGGTYCCYGYPNMEVVKRAFQEYVEYLEEHGMLDDDGHFISKEKVSAPTETQNEI